MLDLSISAFTRFGCPRRKTRVAGAEPFVEQQDLRIDRGGDGETEPHQHARGIGAYRQRQVIAELGERLDLRQFALDLVARHPEQQPACHDVFVTGIVSDEPGRGAEQRRNAAVNADRPLAWLVDSGKYAQHGRFAGAVMAENAQLVAVIDRKRHIVERPHDNAFRRAVAAAPQTPPTRPSSAERRLG